jgi:hypothetical protein
LPGDTEYFFGKSAVLLLVAEVTGPEIERLSSVGAGFSGSPNRFGKSKTWQPWFNNRSVTLFIEPVKGNTARPSIASLDTCFERFLPEGKGGFGC